MQLEPRKDSDKSIMSRLDDFLLIAVAVAAGLVAFTVLGWVLHTVLFLVKVAVAAVVFGLIVRLVVGRRSST
jgi:Flp pilus assembly protein TadB